VVVTIVTIDAPVIVVYGVVGRRDVALDRQALQIIDVAACTGVLVNSNRVIRRHSQACGRDARGRAFIDDEVL
jgi:hypothetical protein